MKGNTIIAMLACATLALPFSVSAEDDLHAMLKALSAQVSELSSRPCKKATSCVIAEFSVEIEMAGSPGNWFNRG
jgi:hypothetical protein